MNIAVTQSLLDSLAGASAVDNHIRLASGADKWLHVSTIGGVTWTLGASGSGAYSIAAVDLGRLIGGTAQTDGSWLDANGAQWHLDIAGSFAQCAEGPEPDPG